MTRFFGHISCVVAAVIVAGCSQQDSPSAAEVDAATESLMATQVQPEAQVYWDAVQFISDADGLHEIVPETDADWERTIEAARELKALGEELQQPAYAANRGADWQDFSQGLVDIATRAEAAALSKDPHKVLDAGGVLYNVCSACHEQYMELKAGAAPIAQRPADLQQ